MRYDNATNNADLLPGPVIEHFLKDAASGAYKGFPRVGITSSSTRDPQFRRFLGLNANTPGGIYIADVLRDGPAGRAGIEKGDVVLAVDGLPVDQDGNYRDPDYGKIGMSHLLTRHCR
jgi:predicted metalloprotease with PDZ domain